MDRFTGTLLPWLRFSVRPRDAAERVAQASAPVCYVLDADRALDLRVLQRACAQAGLPRPRKALPAPGPGPKLKSLLVLTRKVGFWRTRVDRRPPPELRRLLRGVHGDDASDVLLVPVAVYWGRAPRREHVSWFRLLFSTSSISAFAAFSETATLLPGASESFSLSRLFT